MSRAATTNMFDILSEDGPKQPAPAKAAEPASASAGKTAAPAASGKKDVVGAQKPARETQNRGGDKSDAPARSNNRILLAQSPFDAFFLVNFLLFKFFSWHFSLGCVSRCAPSFCWP